MIFSYARVSTQDQNLDRQQQAINNYCQEKGIKIDRGYEEKVSGKNFDRPRYNALLETLRSGDTLIIKELDRLGRDMDGIKKEWQKIQDMGVDIIVIDNEMLSTSNKTDLEKKLISNIVFELLAYMAEKERQKIRSRQAEGIKIAKGKNVYKGRKRIDDAEFLKAYDKWKKGEITGVQAAKMSNMSKNTFYRRCKEIETI